MRWHIPCELRPSNPPPGGTSMHGTRVLYALAAVIVAVAIGPAVSAQADTTTVLTGDVVHHLDAATLVGPVSASQPITVGVFLSNPNQAAEDAYVNSLYDPSSANYQNFLDPDTFDTQFGVPAATVQ